MTCNVIYYKSNAIYLQTCSILAPNKAPGLEVGTRLRVTSLGVNFSITFKVQFLKTILCVNQFSCNQVRLN